MRANKKSIGEPNHRPAGVRNNAGGLHHHRRGLRGQVMQMPGSNRTVLDFAAALAGGRTSSRELVDAALARVAAPDGEGARTFARCTPIAQWPPPTPRTDYARRAMS